MKRPTRSAYFRAASIALSTLIAAACAGGAATPSGSPQTPSPSPSSTPSPSPSSLRSAAPTARPAATISCPEAPGVPSGYPTGARGSSVGAPSQSTLVMNFSDRYMQEQTKKAVESDASDPKITSGVRAFFAKLTEETDATGAIRHVDSVDIQPWLKASNGDTVDIGSPYRLELK